MLKNMKNRSKVLALICTLMLLFTVMPSSVSASATSIYINAENVVEGGQGVGFYDSSGSSLEAPWVSSELSYTVVLRNGEWVKYEAKIPTAGEYNILLRYGKGPNGYANITVVNETTGESVTNALDGTETYYGNMQDFVVGKFNMKAGKNTIVVKDPQDAIYMDMVIIEPVVEKGEELDFSEKEGPYKKYILPCVIEAEDYDKGVTGSKSSDGKNSKGKYRKDDPLDIDETQKGSNEFYLILQSDEYANYTFECEYTDVYNLTLNFFSNGSASVYIDDCIKSVDFEKVNEGKSIVSKNVYLKKGTHTVQIKPTNGELQLDSFAFSSPKNYDDVFDPTQIYVSEDENKKENIEIETKNEVYKEIYVSENGDDSNDGSKNSPFKTLLKAKETVRSLRDGMTGDIYVYIEPGYYRQYETLTFDENDGGKDNYNVIYKGTTPFKESIIGGGTHITGWTKTDNEIYTAHFDSDVDIRNLYINDVPAIRARSKYQYRPEGYYTNEGSTYNQDGMIFSQKNFPINLNDPSRMECWWVIQWVNHIRPVKDVILKDDGKAYVEMEQPYFGTYAVSNSMTSPVANNSPVVFVNDLAFLDEPGEFYFDIKTKTIYYYPREGENLNNVYAGETELLIKADGTKENKVKNLYFERLSFKYGAFNEANNGIVTGQADVLGSMYETNTIPGQVAFNHAQNVRVKDCHFVALGSAGVTMTNDVSDSKIIGNVFNDISGSAVSISNYDPDRSIPEDMVRCSNIEVTNNLIRRVSNEYRASPAITVYYAKNIKVSHNDIEDVPYSGISSGWGWKEFDHKDTGGHEYSYNRIVDVMDTQDGAHFYSLGPQRGTKVFGNYFWYTRDYRGGLYFDEGSGYIEAYNNVVGGSGESRWCYARSGASLIGISVHDNFSDTTVSEFDPRATENYNNKVEPDGANGNWSAEAQTIIDNAGLEDGYSHLYEKAEIIDSAKDYLKKRPNSSFVGRNEWVAPASYKNYYEPQGLTPAVYSTGNIGNTEQGEWEEYDVKIYNSGMHKFYIQAGTALADGCTIRLTVDGEVYDDIELVQNEDKTWNAYEVEGGEYYLEKGVHTVRIEHYRNNFMFGPFKFVYGENSVESDPEYDEGKLPSQIKADEPCQFDDLKTHWSKDNVLSLYEAGIINGVTETEFAPDRAITLYETVLLAMRSSGEDETKWEEKLTKLNLSDKIATVNNPVTREEFCDVIMKFYADKKGSYSMTADYNAFNDFSMVSEKYYPAVWGAKTIRLMSGDTNGNFNPKNTLTRGEAATVINRFYAFVK